MMTPSENLEEKNYVSAARNRGCQVIGAQEKGKAHYIEVYSDSGDEGDETDQEQEGLQVAEEEQQQVET